MEYEVVIGLEVHLQLKTRTKVFCGCSTEFGKRPNSQTCPVCLGLPGSLPKLNASALLFSKKVAMALSCKIRDVIKFDRKNYYYPDLPKNFQISQYDMPVGEHGHVEIFPGASATKVRIKRVHLEEDAGKLIHDTPGPYSFVDYNRAGMPLLEIVTEPDIHSPDEAYEYLTRLKAILKYLDVSDCDMEKGSLRCDANISVRPRGATLLGTKVELKNMNSFKHVRAGLEYEASRQIEAVKAGERIFQETRLWDPEKGITVLMRSKEEAHDYRYFPEPDLVPFAEDVAITLPELPAARADRFREKMALSDYDAGVLTSEKETADYFEECLALYKNPKTIANWITGEMMARANEKGLGIRGLNISPAGLAELLTMIDEGLISGKIAKEIVTEMIAGGGAPREIVAKKGLAQISDTEEIEKVARMVIEQNPKSVSDYKGGKKNALGFLVGQVMKETKGKANPALVNETLARLIG